MKTIYVYTDGACSGNQYDNNIGGYGAILQYGPHKKEIYGGEKNTTNNRMELLAIIEALKLIKEEDIYLEIYSDSSYVVECFVQGWFLNWEKNGWKTSKKTPVENQELWMTLIQLVRSFHEVKFYRVKGHLDLNKQAEVKKWYEKFTAQKNISYEDYTYLVTMNNRADELANIAMDEIKTK
ncbi:MAG: ribonuclease HI [Clostridia bacterium]|nr:ribonuclease HI [Clostridia bacterium]